MSKNNQTILNNSRFDGIVKMDLDDDYSPRPDPDEELPKFQDLNPNSHNPLEKFELKFNENNEQNFQDPQLNKLFSLIQDFLPNEIEILPHFKPFLPSLIPAIGSIDSFIKVPRPDNEFDELGITILDEPSIGCSDPQIFKMQLREKYGIVQNNETEGFIGFIKNLEQNNQKELDTFLESYEELIRFRPPPSIVYSYKMPELEELMEHWPDELEKAFNSIPIPSSDLDISFEEYLKIICSLLDIPIKDNIIESLHLLFTLYQTFKQNFYFGEDNK